MTKKYELAVFIGSFQPFHNGHLDAARKALTIANRVLFLVGSANLARSPKNPFTFAERRHMIEMALHHEPIHVESLDDVPEEEWIARVQTKINKYQEQYKKVCLVGHLKDSSSYYLKIFPQYRFEDLGETPLLGGQVSPTIIDATRIRDLMFNNHWSFIRGAIPDAIFPFLTSWTKNPDYGRLADEHLYLARYKQSWANTPYPPVFITTDAVVVQSGHVLLIERGGNPGKGLLAPPGGFLGQNDFIKDSCIRELIEETSIKLQPEVLTRCIVAQEVFDRPDRSQRGRTVTHAFLFRLDDTKPLPPVRGADDANHALWVPFNKVLEKPNLLFEDHHQIVTVMLRKLRSNNY